MPNDRPTVAVFAPFLNLTITVERAGDVGHDDIHIHPGGQGFWISRMLRHLGERPVLCAPVGGETGRALRGLIGEWGIDLSPVSIESRSPSYVHDRRSGERETIAEDPPPTLGRHELDDLYGRFLDHAMAAGLCVVTGQPAQVIDNDVYRRLGTDLASAEVQVVGDLHGDALAAYLDGGPIRVLKVSEEDLREDGILTSGAEPDVIEVISELHEAGAVDVVVSRSKEPAVASIGGRLYRVTPPPLEPADHRGAGDSMTAALTRSLARSAGPEETLRLAAAAGAANVTRHGLGSASKDLIDELAKKVELVVLDQQVVK